jgi:hypothetical protein
MPVMTINGSKARRVLMYMGEPVFNKYLMVVSRVSSRFERAVCGAHVRVCAVIATPRATIGSCVSLAGYRYRYYSPIHEF